MMEAPLTEIEFRFGSHSDHPPPKVSTVVEVEIRAQWPYQFVGYVEVSVV
jgi:hypothetical protein